MLSCWLQALPAHLIVPAASCPADYICGGPLLEAAGITAQQVQQDAATWEKLGRQLALQLGFDHNSMDDVQRYDVWCGPGSSAELTLRCCKTLLQRCNGLAAGAEPVLLLD
jgi:hypothetical protein